MPLWQEVSHNTTLMVVGVKQASRSHLPWGHILSFASTTRRKCVCVRVCMGILLFQYIYDPHMVERSRKLCTQVPGVGVGLLKWENPAAWKTQRSAILAWMVMCQNVRGVSDQKMSTAHNLRAQPYSSLMLCLCNLMFMQWKDWTGLRWMAEVKW